MFITEVLLSRSRPLGLVALRPGRTAPGVSPQREAAQATRPNHPRTTDWRHRQRGERGPIPCSRAPR
eukprot:7539582-Alexandrium_andersonii.AAC.1